MNCTEVGVGGEEWERELILSKCARCVNSSVAFVIW